MTKLIFYRYAPWQRVVLISIPLILIVLTFFFFFPMIVFDLFFLVPMIMLALWAALDKTVISYDDNLIQIKEVLRTFSNSYKVKFSNVTKYQITNQKLVNNYVDGPSSRIPIPGQYGMKYTVDAGSKSMLAIQTPKRVIKIGRRMKDEEIEQVYSVIDQKIKNLN